MKKETPILVTGNPRSGTTIVGAMLALPTHVGMIYEPFQPLSGVVGFDFEFPYFTKGDPKEEKFRKTMQEIFTGGAAYKRNTGRGRFGPLSPLLRQLFQNNLAYRNLLARLDPRHSRFLVKDPHLFLAAEYLHREFGMACVIMVRHPAAVVASYKRLTWDAELRSFTDQPLLVKRHLEQMRPFDSADLSVVERAAYHWLWCNKVLLDYRRRNPDMIFVRHEDFALDPVPSIRRLYEQLNLPFTERVERQIWRHTSTENKAPPLSNKLNEANIAQVVAWSRGDWKGVVKRDSRKTVSIWKNELSAEEQDTVHRITGEICHEWYRDHEL